MKRTLSLLALCGLLAVCLAACGGDTPDSTPPASTAASNSAASSSAPESAPASQGGSADSTPASTPASQLPDPSAATGALGDHALEEIVSEVLEAAGIEATIPVTELDLRAGGVNLDNIASFVGFESQTASEDGGIVIVIQTQPGMMDTVAEDMLAFRDSRLDDRYAEFATAMEHTGNATTSYNYDLVIYAVSATGDYETLNDTISDIILRSNPAAEE